MVRALYVAYDGPLYRVQRADNGLTFDVPLLSAGGYANARAQDSFCLGTICYIAAIYDQSPQGNDLISVNSAVPANAMPIQIAGQQAYGLYISPGMGFSDRSASGTATMSQGEGIYMVSSSALWGGFCCFDYGNAERAARNDGAGTMHSIYWGGGCWWGYCAQGKGPWIAFDLEEGWYYSDAGSDTNANDTGSDDAFVSLFSSTDGTKTINRKTGNAQSGGLTTWYSGDLPQVGRYAPLKLEGGIILGTGGDNSHMTSGLFFEGAMTIGRPADAVDDQIQNNIVNAGYTSLATCDPGPQYFISQPLGGPCGTSADCARGLSCISSTAQYSSTKTPESQTSPLAVATNLCTITCEQGPYCPSGSTCLNGAQVPSGQRPDAGTFPICIPTCSSDSDCQLGDRAQACVAIDSGISICEDVEAMRADAGVPCIPPNCTTTCPAGFQIVDFECEHSSYCGKWAQGWP
jgi:hypothetical protein